MKKIRSQKENGITLIALVITIIVLLILAAISIATLIGENGILTKASDSKTQTQIAEIKELAKTDILGIQAENESGDITKDQLKEVLEKYFKEVPEELPDDITGLELPAKEEHGGHIIKVSDIWNGIFPSNKVTFTLDISNWQIYSEGDSHGGTFEVVKGTTWEQFFTEKFPNDWDGWIYYADTGGITIYEMEFSAQVGVRDLLNLDGTIVKKEDLIISRNLLSESI